MSAERELLQRFVDADDKARSICEFGDMAVALCDEARALLAQPERQPLTGKHLHELWDALAEYHGREPFKLSHLQFARAIEREHGIAHVLIEEPQPPK